MGARISGRNAHIYIDDTSGGSAAVGTATLTLLTSQNEWSFNATRNSTDTTCFGDPSMNSVKGLPAAKGDFKGFIDFDASSNTVKNVLNASGERGLMIFPDYTNHPTWYVSGKAYFDGQFGGTQAGAVTMDITFDAGPTGLTVTSP